MFTAPSRSVRVRGLVQLRDRGREALRARGHWTALHGLVRFGLGRAARSGDAQARFMLATQQGGDVLGTLESLRGQGEVVRGLLGHATADHARCRELLTSPDFRTGIVINDSPRLARFIEKTQADHFDPIREPSMLVTEAPDHTRMRKLATGVFTGRAVARLQVRTEEIATTLLDELEAAGTTPVDLVDRYCARLPVAVISEILGVPPSEEDRVLELGTSVAGSLDLGASWPDSRATEQGLADFQQWIETHLARLRAEPGDNLLSQLVTARDRDNALSEVELVACAGLILAAGFETTVNLLSNGIALLHDHPEQLAHLREHPEAPSSDAAWGNAVEEVLRLDPPVLLSGRHALHDTEFGGVRVRAGSMVTAIIAGANRDPKVFIDPDVFNVRRENAAQHLSFSAGRHHCLGAALARMEGRVGLQMFFERFPDVRLVPGAERRPTRILRGWERLPAVLTR